MMRRLAVLVLGLASCTNSTFVSTDPNFRPREKAADPEVYVDRLPPRPFRSVGIIELVLPSNATLADAMRHAQLKGALVGCDVVIDRRVPIPDAATAYPTYPQQPYYPYPAYPAYPTQPGYPGYPAYPYPPAPPPAMPAPPPPSAPNPAAPPSAAPSAPGPVSATVAGDGPIWELAAFTVLRQPAGQTTVYQTVPAPPPSRFEFVCGVYGY